MLIHLGQNYTALLKDIELILDYKNIIENPINSTFLKSILKATDTIIIDSEHIKSVIIAKKRDKFVVYYSPIRPDTLMARSKMSDFKSYTN